MSSVYPVGYSSNGAQERIDALLSLPSTLLIDTRIKPTSWNERWRKAELELKYGKKYRWAGQSLGNKALGTGRIEIADPVNGIAGLISYLNKGHDLILLCQCREFSKCHVNTICNLLLERMPEVEIVHDKPSRGSCAVCGEPATLASPSGRPEGMYCEQHGYCKRCRTSVAHFVKYPYGEFYACPCVTKFALQQMREEEAKQAKQVALF